MIYNLQNVLNMKLNQINKEIVFVCIGTIGILGDSFGPLVGSYLKENTKFKIYGDIENNICSIKDINNIRKKLKNKKIIAIDSAVSDVYNIGEIFISSNTCEIGKGINKYKGQIGDITIKAVVAEKHKDISRTMENLKNVDIEFVKELAKNVGKMICNSI